MPTPTHIPSITSASTTQITTLPSGLTVASEDLYGQVATIGAYLPAGAGFEDESTRGAAAFLSNLAFSGAGDSPDKDLATEMVLNGMHPSAMCDRDILLLKVSALRHSADAAIDSLAKAFAAPAPSLYQALSALETTQFQSLDMRDQPQAIVTEMMAYEAGFGAGSPLAAAAIDYHTPDLSVPPTEAQAHAATEAAQAFKSKFMTLDRLAIVGVNVDHEVLVKAVQASFDGAAQPAAAAEASSIPRVLSGTYTGSVVSRELPTAAGAPQEFWHVAIAFPATGWQDDDIVLYCVLDTMLGGGSSFSAGGPGKGMYSRIYTDVLARYGWIQAASCFTTQTATRGMFGLYGACHAADGRYLCSALLEQLAILLARGISDQELSRAKNQLASAMMMNLETRDILSDDIGRQVVVSGQRADPRELLRRIQAVTASDLKRVVEQTLSQRPSVAVLGAPAPGVRLDLDQISKAVHMLQR